jgi:hypothetical protein
MLIIQSSQWAAQPTFFSLTTDPVHFDSISASLKIDSPLESEPTQPNGPGIRTPDPRQVPTDIPPVATNAQGLTIEEYPIVDASIDSPGHFEFNDRIPAPVKARREAWRSPSLDERQAELNVVLKPLGYELRGTTVQSDPRFALYQGETLVKDDSDRSAKTPPRRILLYCSMIPMEGPG